MRDYVCAVAMLFAIISAGAAPLDQPTPEVLTEAKRIVQEMSENPRGPYSRIRWFCNDGSVQPPVAYACREHGGGRQHAEYSPARQRLSQLGWSVGTIFAAMTFEELFHSRNRQQRLREIPLERYLTDVDDGWVLKRAKGYRGRLQVEDENAAGKRLLIALLREADWASQNFLLIREAARTIPHGDDTDFARTVRRQSTQLAEMDPAAEPWRAEIHSDPDAGTAARLRAWAAAHTRLDVGAMASEIASNLDLLYGTVGRRGRIDAALERLGNSAGTFRSEVRAALAGPPLARIAGVCAAMFRARLEHFDALDAEGRLALVDALRELESDVLLAYQELDPSALTRRETLRLGTALLDCSFAAGLISESEMRSVAEALDFEGVDETPVAAYRAAVARLKRVPGWALGSIRYSFAEPMIRYTALDPRAARFSDDLLRGSPMWALGEVLKTLSRDADVLSGSLVEIAGRPVGAAVALNSGVASGTLRIFDTLESLEHATLSRTDVAVIPETIAELSPVAGILTLGEGNALSHVQLLARNFGIPNVAIDHETVELLRPLEDQRVVLIVTGGGDVLLERDAAPDARTDTAGMRNVSIPQPDLSVRRVLPLGEIGRELSGKIVGPKAANLGELNRLFPGRVAPAVAVPFGVYAAHLDRAGLSQRIAKAFAGRADQSLDEAAFGAELAAVRREIAALELLPAIRTELADEMRKAFGAPGTYGVFVRSDTNVEDLPQFTGAGLNETLPHVVAPEAQIAAVPRVWSSVLSPRALAWRSSVLANPEQIYASVLLMKSVPATKSGVLVTTNFADREAPGMTASTAWGVGGAVAGEAAETIVILPDRLELISESKSPYRRHLAASGGVDWLPAAAGRVLEPAEIEQLRALAREVAAKYEPVYDEDGNARPWDIEFGFVDGALTLFQIRPLVERGSGSADRMLEARRQGKTRNKQVTGSVKLDAVPAS